jgi:hypothetical protein
MVSGKTTGIRVRLPMPAVQLPISPVFIRHSSGAEFSQRFITATVLILELICFVSLPDSLRSEEEMPDVTTDRMRCAGYVSSVDVDFMGVHRDGRCGGGNQDGISYASYQSP